MGHKGTICTPIVDDKYMGLAGEIMDNDAILGLCNLALVGTSQRSCVLFYRFRWYLLRRYNIVLHQQLSFTFSHYCVFKKYYYHIRTFSSFAHISFSYLRGLCTKFVLELTYNSSGTLKKNGSECLLPRTLSTLN